MTNDVEHLIRHPSVYFGIVSVQVLCLFFIELFSYSWILFANIFSHCCSLQCHWTVSFADKTWLILMKSNLSFHSLYIQLLMFSLKNICLSQYHSQISQYISLKTFDNFILFRPVIHVMLKFMYVNYVSKFSFCKGLSNCFCTACWKNYPFSNQKKENGPYLSSSWIS